jgi:hypothetical protein
MGLRSSFPRVDRDFYPTPPAAAAPLIPYLRRDGIKTFAEPCAGAGDLVRHLESAGLHCVYRGDITDGQDALAVNSYGAIDGIATNPPHDRKLLLPMIAHFQRIAVSWLLLPVDFAQNIYAVSFLPSCSDIVAIGRMKIFPDSDYGGKSNYAWYRFDAAHTAGPVFHGRDQQPNSNSVGRCAQCGRAYMPIRASSRFCSGRCRIQAFRMRA